MRTKVALTFLAIPILILLLTSSHSSAFFQSHVSTSPIAQIEPQQSEQDTRRWKKISLDWGKELGNFYKMTSTRIARLQSRAEYLATSLQRDTAEAKSQLVAVIDHLNVIKYAGDALLTSSPRLADAAIQKRQIDQQIKLLNKSIQQISYQMNHAPKVA